jgi:hypothetical protein
MMESSTSTANHDDPGTTNGNNIIEQHKISPSSRESSIISRSNTAATTSPMTLAEARAAATHIHHLVLHYRDATFGSSPNNNQQHQPQQYNKNNIEHYNYRQPTMLDGNNTIGTLPPPPPFKYYDPQIRTEKEGVQQPLFTNIQPTTMERRPVKKMHRRSGSFGKMYSHHQRRMHQRENSAGLDILSAAADGMNPEELASVAAASASHQDPPNLERNLSTSSINTAGSGLQANKHHSRDLSLSAFGSLGSWDLKRLMNCISPQPPSDTTCGSTSSGTAPNNSFSNSNITLPSEIDQSTHPQQNQQHLLRSDTPTTPMISNLDQTKVSKAYTDGGSIMHPLLPNITTTNSSVPPSFRDSHHHHHYHRRHHHYHHNSLQIFSSESIIEPAVQQQTQQYGVALEPRKQPYHHPTFSGFLNTMVAPEPYHPYSRESHHPQPPHHFREPSEPAKLLMQLEQAMEQQNSIGGQKQPDIYRQQQQQPIYGLEPPVGHGEVVTTSPRLVVGQMRFPSTVALSATASSDQQQQSFAVTAPNHEQPIHASIVDTSYSALVAPKASNKRKQLDEPPAVPAMQQPPGAIVYSADAPSKSTMSVNSTDTPGSGGGKRVRRKCSVANCENRVVQGGLCISHGAKRKQCTHPGCNKNVKKAGLCSSHGPARKKCEHPNCSKVAVQGGKCITHGAKKKLCLFIGCEKQGIINGHCKKHHDLVTAEKKTAAASPGAIATPSPKSLCVPIVNCSVPTTITASVEDYSAADTASGAPQEHPLPYPGGHTRGLSIFHDMQAMEHFIVCDEAITPKAATVAVQNLPRKKEQMMGSGNCVTFSTFDGPKNDSDPSNMMDSSVQHQKQPLHNRGLSLFGDEHVSDAIISGVLISGGP